jgi:ABC-type transport system involved in cytochrome c biogenesis permease subunit
MDKKAGTVAFILLTVLILVMGWATWDEHVNGSSHAYLAYYNSLWFVLLWFVAAMFALYHITERLHYRRLSVFLLHASFFLILAGALVTRLAGKTGYVHLREDEATASFFRAETQSGIPLPFSLQLRSFEIEYYPGTQSPANYISVVEVADLKTGERFERKISMNRILRYKGFRFYQSSFDEDGKGSILSVNHDPWGIFLSYSGYFLMFFSTLLFLSDKRERFRLLLKKLSQKSAAVIIVLMFCQGVTAAVGARTEKSLMTPDSLTVSAAEAERLGQLWAEYQGRIAPVQTLACDFTVKLTGKDHYKYASAEQVFWGWLLFPEKWQRVLMFEVRSNEMKQLTGTSGQASLIDFFDREGQYKLAPYHRRIYGSNNPEGWLKEAREIDEKINLIETLLSGDLLRIFPLETAGGRLQWHSANLSLPAAQADSTEVAFVGHFFAAYRESVVSGSVRDAGMLVGKLSSLQQENVGDTLPSAAHLKAEQLYNRSNIFSLLFKINLTIGCLCLLFFIRGAIQGRSYPRVEAVSYILLWILFAAASLALGLRAYIGGRIPVSNGYETMLLLSWFSLLTGILAHRYSALITPFSFLLAGFTLLVAHISSMSPQITPLVPVLQSPLLSVHVLTIMVSYGLCGFMALNSLAAFTVYFSCGGSREGRAAYVLRMKETCELFMYPATFLMGAGIFIGAIWANMSWGRYWGWDPKEVWALITFLLMGLTFHKQTLTWFRNPLFYHVFIWVIFLSVLMTYFGVNYILGGRHSYAG